MKRKEQTMGTAQTPQDKNPIQVAGRLFAALEYLADNGPSGLSDIAGAIGLNKSTAHRIMASLQYMGYVTQSEATSRYEATFKVVELANRLVRNADLSEKIRPHLKELSEETGETVHFVKLDGTDVVYIDKVEPEGEKVRMESRIGRRIPFYRSAVGKALAAAMPEPEVKKLWDACRIERTTPYTITDYGEFQEALSEVRRKGYALDNEENEQGVRCIGIALDLYGSQPSLAISISVPISRMDNDRIREFSGYLFSEKEAIEGELRGVRVGREPAGA
ncbi:MAG: IclR family transcriptional regulator [Lachnospiraceae bacterium]|nr:IclR family transcriptional regulator [Lachnospiraceae bacterium]